MRKWMKLVAIAGMVLGGAVAAPMVWAEDAPAPQAVTLADGKIQLQAPGNWTKKKPRTNIVEAEFEAAAAEGDEIAGRMTIMGAGGAIEDNIKRWEGQFKAANGGEVKAKTEKLEIAGQAVHWVDLAGTYADSPGGPFAGGKTVQREKYRMLGAIVQTKKSGNYFLKFYGPEKTITENEKAFRAMVDSLSVK